jgi:hypothetical protein
VQAEIRRMKRRGNIDIIPGRVITDSEYNKKLLFSADISLHPLFLRQ